VTRRGHESARAVAAVQLLAERRAAREALPARAIALGQLPVGRGPWGAERLRKRYLRDESVAGSRATVGPIGRCYHPIRSMRSSVSSRRFAGTTGSVCPNPPATVVAGPGRIK